MSSANQVVFFSVRSKINSPGGKQAQHLLRFMIFLKTKEQAEGCTEQENMGVSILALLKAGVQEGKIPDTVLRKVEINAETQPAWFKPPVGRHPGRHSVVIEEE